MNVHSFIYLTLPERQVKGPVFLTGNATFRQETDVPRGPDGNRLHPMSRETLAKRAKPPHDSVAREFFQRTT
jgi:hypothetical protein